MFKNQRQWVATVTQGKGRTLQGDGSDVSLTIPAGVHGVYMTRVHTEHSRFINVIPDDECLVGPLVEVAHHAPSDEVKEIADPYVLKIPHCIRDQKNWRFIKVRSGSIYKQQPFRELPSYDGCKGESYFKIDRHFITVYTYHFCHFTCTMCKKSCPAAARVFLGGSLSSSSSDNRTDVEIKAFLCSFLYLIPDFKKVCYWFPNCALNSILYFTNQSFAMFN